MSAKAAAWRNFMALVPFEARIVGRDANTLGLPKPRISGNAIRRIEPEFTHATELVANQGRDMKYDRAKYARRQAAGYGELAPLKVAVDPDATFAKVEATAKQMPTWLITSDDPKARALEGIATSALFHFHDDFVIQVRPAPDGTGSLIEMRSKSRDGIGDFGVNYKRIRTFFDALGNGTPA